MRLARPWLFSGRVPRTGRRRTAWCVTSSKSAAGCALLPGLTRTRTRTARTTVSSACLPRAECVRVRCEPFGLEGPARNSPPSFSVLLRLRHAGAGGRGGLCLRAARCTRHALAGRHPSRPQHREAGGRAEAGGEEAGQLLAGVSAGELTCWSSCEVLVDLVLFASPDGSGRGAGGCRAGRGAVVQLRPGPRKEWLRGCPRPSCPLSLLLGTREWLSGQEGAGEPPSSGCSLPAPCHHWSLRMCREACSR